MSADSLRTRPGRPYPLGATWDGAGVNFALFSDHATGVELCLFDPADPGTETQRVPVTERTDQVWHVYLPEGRPGLLYGYRVDGPYEPAAGHRFNPRKLLLDPYAKAIAGAIEWGDAIFGYRVGDPEADLSRDDRDSAPFVPKSVGRGLRVYLGGRPAASHAVAPHGDLRGPRQGLHRPEPGRPGEAPRARTPASPPRRPSST